jgi:hypothetical protein
MRRTQDEIYREGLQALRDRLGRAGMIRFLQQFERGRGNYSRERHKWVDQLSLDDLRTLARRQSPRKKRRTQ